MTLRGPGGVSAPAAGEPESSASLATPPPADWKPAPSPPMNKHPGTQPTHRPTINRATSGRPPAARPAAPRLGRGASAPRLRHSPPPGKWRRGRGTTRFSGGAPTSPPAREAVSPPAAPDRAFPRAVRRRCRWQQPSCLPPPAASSGHAERGETRGRGRPGRGAPHPFTVTPPHPHFQRGRDRFCLKEIAAQQVRTRLGSGMWKYDSEQLLLRARPAGPRQGERGERGPGPGPREGGGAGPGPSPRRPGRPRGPSRASRTSCQGDFNTSG